MTCEAMKTKITNEEVSIVPYTTVANHLLTTVSELLDYLSRHHNVSGVTYGSRIGGGGGNYGGTQSRPGPHYVIFNVDRSIHTDHHQNWMFRMDPEDKKS